MANRGVILFVVLLIILIIISVYAYLNYSNIQKYLIQNNVIGGCDTDLLTNAVSYTYIASDDGGLLGSRGECKVESCKPGYVIGKTPKGHDTCYLCPPRVDGVEYGIVNEGDINVCKAVGCTESGYQIWGSEGLEQCIQCPPFISTLGVETYEISNTGECIPAECSTGYIKDQTSEGTPVCISCDTSIDDRAVSVGIVNGQCEITECISGYLPYNTTCVECPPKYKDPNALDYTINNGVCTITECSPGFLLSSDQQTCELKCDPEYKDYYVDEYTLSADGTICVPKCQIVDNISFVYVPELNRCCAPEFNYTIKHVAKNRLIKFDQGNPHLFTGTPMVFVLNRHTLPIRRVTITDTMYGMLTRRTEDNKVVTDSSRKDGTLYNADTQTWRLHFGQSPKEYYITDMNDDKIYLSYNFSSTSNLVTRTFDNASERDFYATWYIEDHLGNDLSTSIRY